ncbi:MAG: 5-formyltetrahydrofolate cyclo-ligase [Dechloromonas sp.]|nr:5-formyltetrahydrofolate cyclo-ligase [Dechloromonas sp.]
MESRCEDITGWRPALRREMAARRKALTGGEHATLSGRIVAHALAALAQPTIAAFCWPIRNEPDVRALLTRWAEDGVRAALPVVVAENTPLRFREWTPDGPLKADRYGIPTPIAGDWLTPDLILLPLNGFDGAGYRLGYGGGYFDRTLAALVPRPLAVGVGFEINRIDSIQPEPHDQRLDWIITEDGAFRPAA